MRWPVSSLEMALICLVLTAASNLDTARVRPDTASQMQDTISLKAGLTAGPAVRMAVGYSIDTSDEAINLEQYYYGRDGHEASYDFNPWDDYISREGEGWEERDRRDQERDSRE